MPQSISSPQVLPRLAKRRFITITLSLLLITTVAGATSVIAGSAQSGHGLLKVSTVPQGLESVISVDGEARNVGSITGLELPAGDHRVCFGTVQGYTTPACQTVMITEGGATEVEGDFARAGSLQIEVEGPHLDPTISVDGIERDRGSVQVDVLPGDYEVCFEELRNYDPVPCQRVAVDGGETIQVIGSYGGSDQSPEERKDEQPDDGELASAVSRHNITWTFDRDYRVGRYANGDFWVVGPVTIIEIDPPFTVELGGWKGQDWPKNGSMLNPTDTRFGGYGFIHRDEHTYDESQNVAASLPTTIAPDNSLVSTIVHPEPDHNPSLKSASVLTVVDSPPPANSMRPAYAEGHKTVHSADLALDELPRLDLVSGATHPDVLAAEFERLWLDHRTSWNGRKYHPSDAMPAYGRDLTTLLGQGYLTLLLDYTAEEKERLAINLTQFGIDTYGVLEAGAQWKPDGGHLQGRKLPILFAGLMLDDADMLNVGYDYEMPGPAGNEEHVWFGEDGQTFYVEQSDVDRGVGYTTDDIGLPEWGIRHWTRPEEDDASWSAPYRQCCTANSWHGHVLTARVLGLQEAWNHDALFDYTDRYMEIQKYDDSWKRSWDRPFSAHMWDTYASQF